MEEDEEIEKTTARLSAAKEISVAAVVVAVLSKLGIFTFKEEKELD